jgi:HK97 family phage major capsid protein
MPARKLNLHSGDKLPVQHREYKIDKSKIDEESRTCEILFSTDDPAERWFGDEILDHSPGACDLSRLNDGGAFLKDHDPRQQIGVHESASISITAMGSKQRGEGRATVRFAPPTNPLAEQEFRDMLAGVRTKISVGYIAREMKLVEEDEDGNETWLVTKWQPLENSLVSIPLDPACAAGRAADTDEKYSILIDDSFRKRENGPKDSQKRFDRNGKESHKRENQPTSMTPEEQKAADAKKDREEKAAREEREAEVREGMKLAREREKEIRAIAAKANSNLPPSELERAIDNSVSDAGAVDAFRKLVFEKYFGDAKPIDTPSGQGDIKVVGERESKMSMGSRFVNSEQFKRAVAARGQGQRVAALDIPFSTLGIRGKVAMAQRAGFSSGDLTAINVAPQQTLVALGVQRLTIMDLIAPGTTSAAAIPYPRENTYGTIDGVAVAAGASPRAKSVGERGLKPTWEPDLTTAVANVKKIAIVSKVPEEFMADFPGMQSYLDERMPFMVDMETEAEILYGDGLGTNLQGITSAPGIQTRAYATAWGDTIYKCLTDIRVNSFFEPDGIAMHPYDWEVARLEKDLNGQYLAGGPYYIPYGNGVFMEMSTFWGKPVVISTSVTIGKPIVGCWKLGAQYFIREGMRLETTNANEDDFRRNLIAIRAEHRLALAVYRPVSFEEVTGGPART